MFFEAQKACKSKKKHLEKKENQSTGIGIQLSTIWQDFGAILGASLAHFDRRRGPKINENSGLGLQVAPNPPPANPGGRLGTPWAALGVLPGTPGQPRAPRTPGCRGVCPLVPWAQVSPSMGIYI